MELQIKNKWISLKGSSIVQDVNGKDVLKVRGKFWTFTRKKFIETLDGEVKYIVRNKFWTLFQYRAFIEGVDKKKIATIRRKVFSLHDRFFVDTPYGQAELKGNILGFDYHIYLNGKEVGHVARRISLRDSFVLNLDDDLDYYFFVALVVAIDNITDERQANYN